MPNFLFSIERLAMSNFFGFIESNEDADKQIEAVCNEDADMQIGAVCKEDARGIRQW